MALIHYSFVEFFPPDAYPYTVADSVPLPVQVGDVLAVQAPLANSIAIVGVPLTNIRLGLCQATATGWQLMADDVLPILFRPNGVWINPYLAIAFPAVATGVYHFCLYYNSTIYGVSNALAIGALAEPNCVLRYRNNNTDPFFDYSFAGFYNQLRLPLRLDRPAYPTLLRRLQGWDGQAVPLYARFQKNYLLETDYLPEPLVDALTVALQHDHLELYNPNTASWFALLLLDGPKLTWQPNPAFARAQATATLQVAVYIPVPTALPPGDFYLDFSNDFNL